ncbi:hypothetical protein A3Q56_01807 [Intoshia linei]|uniref:PPIase cyclophilin-type domain-containing protein n=1 Tax=Intoshia linei TaxID=1819745 RepID=A0A177B807_9BILA|nr:hypothetical protein A3Q56_01807 [Intoshia linei]
MGKKQHQKDKMYLTNTEWKELYGGREAAKATSIVRKSRQEFKTLPLDTCCLSFTKFKNPYMTPDGYVFDILAIVPYIKTYGQHPVTGKAIEKLNIKPNYWKDLIDGTDFTRKDIITLRHPDAPEKFNFVSFHHVKNKMDGYKKKVDNNQILNFVNSETSDTLAELKLFNPEKIIQPKEIQSDIVNRANYSTGKASMSFTSTAVDAYTKIEPAKMDENYIRYSRITSKAYVSLVTNYGDLNLELYCTKAPKTCENFIKLCESKYYDNVIFHRSIRNFMIQSGDPTGTGSGGDSCWKGTFDDEIVKEFEHKGRGVLSMANSGPNTNRSQFFITFRSAMHLNGKHAIFGRLVGGFPTLTTMEMIKTDKDDHPKKTIKILSTNVFNNPYDTVDAEIANIREEERLKVEKELQVKLANKIKVKRKDQSKKGIGKYIQFKKPQNMQPSTNKKIVGKNQLNDFSK